MSYQFPPDIESLIQEQLVSGNYESADQVLRTALEGLAEQDVEVRAIQESIDLLEQGDEGISLDDAVAKLLPKGGVTVRASGKAR